MNKFKNNQCVTFNITENNVELQKTNEKLKKQLESIPHPGLVTQNEWFI